MVQLGLPIPAKRHQVAPECDPAEGGVARMIGVEASRRRDATGLLNTAPVSAPGNAMGQTLVGCVPTPM
jgi:hypothetical protein